MKKVLCLVLMAALLAGPMSLSAQAASGRGGIMGFIAGCCFGIRTGGDYNEGKEVHWREWCRLIPWAGIVFAIWDGVEGVQGKTTADYRGQYGATFY